MKLTTRVIVPACLLGIMASLGFAQQDRPSDDTEAGDRERTRPRHSERSQRPERPHHQPPPLVRALDADHNGVLSADEIANAPAALATLNRNGDGILTREELAPARPPRPRWSAPAPAPTSAP